MPKLKVSPPEGDPTPKELTTDQRKEWNRYVDWMEAHGMKGSKELDKGDTGIQWFNRYLQENPTSPLKREHVKLVQQEIESIAQRTRDLAKRKGTPNADQIMTGTSKIDDFPGSKTTSFKFPNVEFQQFNNQSLVSKRNLGLVNSQLQPATSPLMLRQKPPDAPLVQMADGWYWQDPKSGDYVFYKK